MYRIILTKQAQKDYRFWVSIGNLGIIKKITEILEDIAAHPCTGIGKPELLKFDLSGKWSRRINTEHRIIYSVNNEMIEIYVLSMKHHYLKK
jgi:toxin YoeB